MLCRLAGWLTAGLIHFSTVVSLPPPLSLITQLTPALIYWWMRILYIYYVCIEMCQWLELWRWSLQNVGRKHVFAFYSLDFHPLAQQQQFHIHFIHFAPFALTHSQIFIANHLPSYIYNRNLMYWQQRRNKVLRL